MSDSTVIEWYVGPFRIIWWRHIRHGWLPYIGTIYGKGFCFWWGRLWIEV